MKIGKIIKISTDFTDTPGARYIVDGEYSGEDFLKNYLLPEFEKAVSGGYLLCIDLDDVWGYPSSFVSGSFGALSREKGKDIVMKYITFISKDSKTREERIWAEIKTPE